MIERELLISLLKLTKNGPVLIKSVTEEAKIPTAFAFKLLKQLQLEGFVNMEGDFVEADTDARLKLAVKALGLGADVQRVSDLLCWQEFESMAAAALEANGYSVGKNVRFKHAGRRWEIDVVGYRKPRVICIDCKHWHHGLHFASLRRVVEAQTQRTEAFALALPSISLNAECTKWGEAEFFPAILSLMPCADRFFDEVPVVAALQLQDFLTQMPVYALSLRHVSRVFGHLGHDFE